VSYNDAAAFEHATNLAADVSATIPDVDAQLSLVMLGDVTRLGDDEESSGFAPNRQPVAAETHSLQALRIG